MEEEVVVKHCATHPEIIINKSEDGNRDKEDEDLRTRFIKFIQSDDIMAPFQKRMVSKLKNIDINFNTLFLSKSWTSKKLKERPSKKKSNYKKFRYYKRKCQIKDAYQQYPAFFRNGPSARKFILKYKVQILNLTIFTSILRMSENKKERKHFTYSKDNTEYINNILQENGKDNFKRKKSDIQGMYGNTDILNSSFSDEIYDQEENKDLILCYFIPSPTLGQQNNNNNNNNSNIASRTTPEFNFKYLSDVEFKNLKSEEKRKVFKIEKIPITLSQMIRYCVEAEPEKVSRSGELSEKDEKVCKYIWKMANQMSLHTLKYRADSSNCKKHCESFFRLFLYNAVFYLLNPKCLMFSYSPFNYFSMKLFFFSSRTT